MLMRPPVGNIFRPTEKIMIIDKGQPEDRHGNPEQGPHHGGKVHPAVLPGGREHPYPDAEQGGEDHGAEGQFHRGGKTFPDLAHNGLARFDGFSEIQVHHPFQIEGVLLRHGLIQSQVSPQPFDFFPYWPVLPT